MALKMQVNPNRMELQRLKKRLKVAKRGHKLLKDKQDALIKEFLKIAKKTWSLRKEIEKEFTDCLKRFVFARSYGSKLILEQLFMVPFTQPNIAVSYHNVMSVNVPQYSHDIEGNPNAYSFAMSSGEMDIAIEKFIKLLPNLIELAQLEKALKLMAVEIEKTRRRVNALEYVLIPGFEETIKYITMKLDEMERSNLSRLMRIKDIVRAH